MEITLFGTVWMLLIGICFLNNNLKYILTITLMSMIYQSASVFVFNNICVGSH